ncbi:MAG: ComEC/Rec2 family competence protein [Chlamydiae bacterium]|nr:ComEC/Rec2 family competence protein [Chlamydiota bacterium]MBI3266702.1 ComEC/Rec2 family competence protein [Chlamydiota bacterium]
MKRPLFYLSLFLASGIFIAHFLPFKFSWFFACVFLLGLACLFFVQKEKTAHLLLYALFFFLGATLYDLRTFFPSQCRVDQIEFLNGEIFLRGEIQRSVEMGGRKNAIIQAAQVKDLENQWKDVTGSVLVRLPEKIKENTMYSLCDSTLSGKVIRTPFSNASNSSGFDEWLKANGISLVVEVSDPKDIQVQEGLRLHGVKRLLTSLRNWGADHLTRGLPADSSLSHLLLAMFLGIRENLGTEVKNAFLYTNTVHILSISGLHLGMILAMVLFGVGLFPVSKRWASGIALFIIWIYALLTGMEPPIVRSAIMASFFLVGRLARMKTDLANALGGAALLMLIVNPLSLLDIGFQLSFLCMLSLVFLTPKVEKDFEPIHGIFFKTPLVFLSSWEKNLSRGFNMFIKILSGSCAVWIGVLPLIAYHFQIFSPVTVLANVIAVPWTSMIMTLGFASCALGWIPGVSQALNTVNGLLLGALVKILHYFSSIPGAYLFVERPTWLWFFIYDAVLLSSFWAKGKIKSSYFLISAFIWVPLLFKSPDPHSLRIKLSSHEVSFPQGRDDLQVSKTFDENGRLETIHFEKNWIHWGLKNLDRFSPQEKGWLVMDDSSSGNEEALLRAVDRLPVAGVVLEDGSFDASLFALLRDRGIETFLLRTGILFEWKTDGENFWVKRGQT